MRSIEVTDLTNQPIRPEIVWSRYGVTDDNFRVCLDCGAVVCDIAQHDHFHRHLDHVAAVADAFPLRRLSEIHR